MPKKDENGLFTAYFFKNKNNNVQSFLNYHMKSYITWQYDANSKLNNLVAKSLSFGMST